MIWLVGAGGLLGSAVARRLSALGEAFVGTGRAVDIRHPAAIERFGADSRIDRVINCAAVADVDRAERDEAEAFAVNTGGAGNLADFCAASGARLVHVSTDYVFDGVADRAYREDDPIGPVNAYGRSKAEGERMVLAADPKAAVVRVSWLYGATGKGFVGAAVAKLAAGEPVIAATDLYGNPTWARDAADVLVRMALAAAPFGGVWHLSCGGASRHELALELERLGTVAGVFARGGLVAPVRAAELEGSARRPARVVLDAGKLRAAGIEPPDWRASLAEYVRGLAGSGLAGLEEASP